MFRKKTFKRDYSDENTYINPSVQGTFTLAILMLPVLKSKSIQETDLGRGENYNSEHYVNICNN